MKLREMGSAVYIGAALLIYFGGAYFGNPITAEDVREKRESVKKDYKIVREYAVQLKDRYVEEREACRDEDGNWASSTQCQTIKDVDPKATKLWEDLKELDEDMKEANQEAKKVEDALERVNQAKDLVLTVANAIK